MTAWSTQPDWRSYTTCCCPDLCVVDVDGVNLDALLNKAQPGEVGSVQIVHEIHSC